MHTEKQKKSGFTLVELMVVAIIVAILAAVAIPLMSGNKERAIATEGQAGCSTIATALKLAYVENGSVATNSTVTGLPSISDGDLDGTYYDHDDYSITPTDIKNFTVKATASRTEASGVDVTMSVSEGKATWTID